MTNVLRERRSRRQHTPTRARARLLVLVGTLALSVAGFGSSPAHAAVAGHSEAVVRTAVHAPTPVARSNAAAPRRCGPGANARVVQRCDETRPPQLSEGGCGFLQRCIYLSRSEQLTILAGGSATIVVVLCSVTALLGCAVASAVVGAAFQWLSNRGGVCPTSKPKLRVRYFPTPEVDGCVA